MVKILDNINIYGNIIYSSGNSSFPLNFPQQSGTIPTLNSFGNSGQLFFSNGQSLVPGNFTYGTLSNITGTLPLSQGGTNADNKTTAFNNLSPSTNQGDLIVHNGSNNVRLAVGSDNSFLMANSKNALGVFYDKPLSWIVTTGDTTDVIGNFKDATGLAFWLDANTNYLFNFDLIFTTTSGACGIGISVSGPTANHLVYRREIPTSNAAGTDNINIQGGIANDGTSTNSASIDTPNERRLAIVHGLIQTGASSGTLKTRFRTELAGQTARIASGSCGYLMKLGTI